MLIASCGGEPSIDGGLDADTDADTDGLWDGGLPPNPMLSSAQIDAMMEYEYNKIRTPWYYPIGSSLLFEAVVLLLAGRCFVRQDF